MHTEYISDQAGFPMLWIEPVKAYVHWLPVSKVQLETFLCSAPNTKYDEGWYNDLLKLNPRVSVKSPTAQNYWQIFATGLFPQEGLEFAEWCGEDYFLPNKEDWASVFAYCNSQPAIEAPASYFKLEGRPAVLVKKIDDVIKSLYIRAPQSLNLASQMLFRYGVMEWVQLVNAKQQPWGGMGQPATKFQSTIHPVEHLFTETPMNPSRQRMSYYGVRLLRREG